MPSALMSKVLLVPIVSFALRSRLLVVVRKHKRVYGNQPWTSKLPKLPNRIPRSATRWVSSQPDNILKLELWAYCELPRFSAPSVLRHEGRIEHPLGTFFTSASLENFNIPWDRSPGTFGFHTYLSRYSLDCSLAPIRGHTGWYRCISASLDRNNM